MANGLSNKQTLDSVYTALVGIDGKSGMKKDIEDAKGSRRIIHEKIENIEKNMVTRAVCEAIRDKMATKAEDNKRWSWKKRIGYFTLQLTVMGTIFGLVQLLGQCSGKF